ncbi:MAG TPA: TadE/TadG family type IV pilus assembly protein [Candidatus Krumholzibacteria bacterium]|nr:TadE/TadG family type IV pilus assembly protein [Candidatus Krumholzibacteria bacterium]
MKLRFLGSNRGTAIVEFAIALPLLILMLLGLVDLCVLLDAKMRLICLSREAANVLSRGADFQSTFTAVENADTGLDLNGANGCIILTRIALDPKGRPIIIAQQTVGGLSHASAVGTLPPNAPSAPAAVPNGRTIPPNMSLVIAEVYARKDHFYGNSGLLPGGGSIVMGSLAAF